LRLRASTIFLCEFVEKSINDDTILNLGLSNSCGTDQMLKDVA